MGKLEAVVSSMTLKCLDSSKFIQFPPSCSMSKVFYLSSRYVGLCAGIKIIALAIFAVDWWLVRRRKHLDKMIPVSTNELVVGSIISLDKCEFFFCFFVKM